MSSEGKRGGCSPTLVAILGLFLGGFGLLLHAVLFLNRFGVLPLNEGWQILYKQPGVQASQVIMLSAGVFLCIAWFVMSKAILSGSRWVKPLGLTVSILGFAISGGAMYIVWTFFMGDSPHPDYVVNASKTAMGQRFIIFVGSLLMPLPAVIHSIGLLLVSLESGQNNKDEPSVEPVATPPPPGPAERPSPPPPIEEPVQTPPEEEVVACPLCGGGLYASGLQAGPNLCPHCDGTFEAG